MQAAGRRLADREQARHAGLSALVGVGAADGTVSVWALAARDVRNASTRLLGRLGAPEPLGAIVSLSTVLPTGGGAPRVVPLSTSQCRGEPEQPEQAERRQRGRVEPAPERDRRPEADRGPERAVAPKPLRCRQRQPSASPRLCAGGRPLAPSLLAAIWSTTPTGFRT